MASAPSGSQKTSRPPLERMLRIHQEIATGEYPNCRALAEKLEVSTKSIQRDLTFMRDRLSLPLDYDSRRYGYFYTEPVTNFPTLQVSEGELFAMLIAEKALHEYRGTDFEKPLASAFRKITESLPETISIHIDAWDNAISFRRSGRPRINLELFDQLSDATTRGHTLNILYKKPGESDPQWRLVDPYHLANIDGDWYLFAYCHLRRDIRTFNPVRVHEIHQTGETFKPQKDFDIQARLRGSFGVIGGSEPKEVRLRFDSSAAEIIKEREWHASQEVADLADGSVELRLRLSNLVEIERWLLAWGASVEVLEPEELRQQIIQSAKAILQRYR